MNARYRIGRLVQMTGAALMIVSMTGSELPQPSVASLSQELAQAANPSALPSASPLPSASASSSPAPLPVQSPSVASSLPAPSATPAATPTPQVVFANLNGLSASIPLPVSASFVPAEGDGEGTLARKIAVQVTLGAMVRLTVNGTAVAQTHLASVANDPKAKTSTFTYVAVPLVPGPNTIVAVPVATNGSGAAVSETVFGPERAANVDASVLPCKTCSTLTADGVSAATLHLVVRDRFNHAAAAGERVLVEIRSGDVRFLDDQTTAAASPQPTAPATDNNGRPTGTRRMELAMPAGGVLDVPMIAGMNPGPIEIVATVEGVSGRAQSYLRPLLRAPFVNGLASVGTGAMPAQVDGSDTYDAGGARRTRLGVFGTGAVSKNSSFTFVYESQNRLAPLSSVGGYTDNPSERPYLTYGDSSIVNDQYRSNDHLYARYDHDRSSVMWGQYQASIASDSVGGYSQLLSGAKADLSFGTTDATRLTLFTARNTLAYAQQIVPVTGLSVLQTPLRPNIVVGSDVFILATLSRASGQIISQEPMIRNQDYSIDYASGIVRFITIPLPFDDKLNPRVLVLQYQYAGPGVTSTTTGGQLRLLLSRDRGTQLIAGAVNDTTGTGNFALSTQTFTRQWQGGQIALAHSRSDGFTPGTLLASGVVATPAPSGGDAFTASITERHNFDDVSAQYAKTALGYSNPFGGLASAGLTTYRVAYRHTIPGTFGVGVSFDGAQNDGTSPNHEQNASVNIFKQLGKRLRFMLGIERHTQFVSSNVVVATPVPVVSPFPLPTGAPLANVSQTQGVFSMEYKPTDRLGIQAERIQTISGSDQGSTQPTQTTAQVSYAFSDKGRIFARELWSVAPAASFSNSVQGLISGESATHVFEVGAERALSPATSVTTDYQMIGSGNSRDIFSTMGVSEKLRFGKNLGGSLFVQGANSVGSDQAGFTVYGLSLAYHNPNNLQSSFSFQRRSGFAGGSTGSFAINGPLGNDVAVAGTLQRSYGTGSVSVNDFLTLALRPNTNDRIITLLGYQRANGFTGANSITNVVSIDQIVRPTNRLELGAKYAFKLDGDTTYTAHTTLLALRAKQTLGDRFDIGGEVRYLNVPGINGAFQTDAAAEAGYLAGNMTRIAFGYDFRGTVDPTLLGQPQHRGVYLTLTTLVDRIFGWGKTQKP